MNNNNIGTIVDSKTVNIPECFVAKANKRKGAGSGESRLYIGSQLDNTIFGSFIIFDAKQCISAYNKNYDACTNTCMLIKDNLLEYMFSIQDISMNPTEDYNGDQRTLFQQRLSVIQNLNPFPRFTLINQNGSTDQSRLYIGSFSANWQLIRDISLPFVTQIQIDKVFDEEKKEICYIFTLHRIQDPSNPNLITKKTNAYADKHNYQMRTIESDLSLSDTEKSQLVISRKGQGLFRNNTLALMPCCPFTGISNSKLLRASHCMPWAECITASDRLDGYNGLTLTPTYDVLFDQGFISFNDDGSLLISIFLDSYSRQILNLIPGKIYIDNSNNLRSRFLSYHRTFIFKG